MNAKRDPWPLLLRWDWAIYLIVIGAMLVTLVTQVPAALAAGQIDVSGAGRDATAVGREPSWAGFDFGALYALLLWIIIPLVAFALVNVGASRRFRRRVESARTSGSVPVVRVKARAAGAAPVERL